MILDVVPMPFRPIVTSAHTQAHQPNSKHLLNNGLLVWAGCELTVTILVEMAWLSTSKSYVPLTKIGYRY